MDGKIKECIDELLSTTERLNKLITEPDEFVVVNEIELKIQEAREVFERTKSVEENDNSTSE